MAWQRSALRRKSITYADSAEPQKRRLVASVAPLAYADAAGEYLPIDMTPERINNAQFNGWRIVNNGWHYGLETDGTNWFGGNRGQHFFKFRLSRIGYTNVEQGSTPDFATDFSDIGGAPTYNTANLSFTPNAIALFDGDATVGALAEWRDLWPALPAGEIYVRWALNGDRLKEEVVITQAAREWIVANRPPAYYGLTASQTWLTFGFRVDWSDVPKRYRNGVDLTQAADFSDADGGIEGRNALDELLFFMPLDEAYVDNGDLIKPRVRLVKRFWRNADGQWWLVVGAKVGDLAALPAGDLVFDPTITPSVAASGDDTLITAFGSNLTETTLLFGYYTGYGDTESVMRFSVSGVENGDTVDDAYLTIISKDAGLFNSADGRIYCQDADSGTIPGSIAAYNAMARTSASTLWQPASWPATGGSVQSPSFTTAVQEVVDRAGFAGTTLSVIIENAGDTANRIASWAAWDDTTYAAPTLTIDYTAGGPAAQTINANAISSTAAVYAPAVTPGTVTIAANAIASGATVYAPAITPGAVEIALDTIASATTVHAPAVTVGAATITPDAISSTAAVYEPAITTGAVTVALDAIDSTAQVYEPAISSGVITITPNVIESTAVVYAPTVTPGAVTVALDAIDSTAQVYEPAITPGAVTISADVISSTAQVYAPAVTPGAVTIQADSISSTAQVYEPAISTGALLVQPNRIESTTEVYAPAISGGAVVIAADAIESGAQVFEPSITPGAVTVAPDFITSSAAVYAPGIGYVIRPNIIDSAAAVYAPAVSTGATTIAAAFIASTAQVYAPTITGGVPAVIGGILITLPTDYTSISVPTDYTSITIPADSGRSS